MSVTEGSLSSTTSPAGSQTTQTPPAGSDPTKTDPSKTTSTEPAKTPEQVAAEKAASDKATAEAVALTPESIKIPEGLQVDEPTRDKFLGILNNAELTPQQRAQALVDLQADIWKQASEKGSQELDAQSEAWKKETETDPTVGGANLQKNLGNISKLVDKYGEPGLREAFDLTGLGNHPKFVRFLHKMATDLVKEGEPPPASSPATRQQEVADRLYNKSKG